MLVCLRSFTPKFFRVFKTNSRTMSGWRGRNRGGNSSYNQHANRLREKLESRNQTEDDDQNQNSRTDRPPPGLRGRDLGMWYAQRSKKNTENKLLSGPNVSLTEEKINKIRRTIQIYQKNSDESSSTRFRNEFQRHNRSDFMDLLKSSAAAVPVECEASDIDEKLLDEFLEKSMSEEYVDMLESRQKLPAHQKKEEIVELVKKNQVILVEGNTGCGKTTQVAQYILDDALMNKKGSTTRILCTQPRRIAATSIAERVASERAEKLGVSVGYQIRLEKVAPRKVGCINFCTTGVLMKFMEIDPALNEYSHIIIDEIHERNVQTDICLALIKQIVRYRKSLKIILMSATLNAESFSQYFYDCPKIHIEGFTHPVQDLYLEDVLEETGFNNFQRPRKEPVWVQHKTHNKRRADDFEVIVGNYASSLRGRYSQSTINCLLNPQTEVIDPGFIENLIHHISYNKPAGAILVILPGYSIISKVFENLQASPQFPSSRFVIYPLHSLLTGSDQRSIFIRPAEGVRKIILATPLAETSITIDDVVYVINAGKMRKPSFDFDRNAKVLEDQWITKANETQRRGRAGRVQPGVCYHLYSRARSNSLEAFEQPEILRIRLEEVLLTIKVLCIKNIKPFLSTLIDVPSDKAVDPSINLLQRLGALTENEELTPLGLHLARLAVHPQIGKMLLFSSIFSCFDPISSVAAALSFKSPFYNVMGKEEQCDNAKRRFSKDSDQLAAANAMKEWKDVQHDLRGFCYRNFLSHSTLMMLDRMKSQFTQSLYQSKFLGDNRSDDDDNNFHSENIDVLRAVICGGLYPNIAYRFMRVSRNKRIERIKSGGKNVKLIPSSVNCDDGSVYDPGYMVFHELQKFTGGFFVMETTSNIGPYAILMFGDRIAPETISDTHFISVSDIVKFRCNQQTAQLIIDLRDCLNQLLEKKIAEPSPTAWDSDEGKLLKAIVELISVTSSSFKDFEQDDDDDF